MKSFLFLMLYTLSTHAISGIKISCESEVEMEYHKVNTLDNQTAKKAWNKTTTPSYLNIELIDDDWILVNKKKQPITNKMAGGLIFTSTSKQLPGTKDNQGTIVMASLAINVMIPEVTKTSLMAKYFLSSDIQASATNYKCKYITKNSN